MINNNTRDIIEKVNDLVVVTERVVSSSKLFTKSFYQTMEVAESTSASIEEIAASLELKRKLWIKLQIHQACWRNRQRICMNWWASLKLIDARNIYLP